MVHSILCHLNPRSARLSACDFWQSDELGRTSNSSVGLVHWQHHGLLHRKFRCVPFEITAPRANSFSSRRVGIRISNGRGDVLCHQACRSEGTCRSMGLDHRMVQFPRSSCGRSKSCIHNIPDDTRHGCYAYIRQGRGCLHPVGRNAVSRTQS
jgi:hypothetical protein